ncbi:hypothetical protein CEXT_129901 [Caerostris extrusa]|uniref:Uncharacterized protein n=1 Tax=Caerostris extrusa TaxID=172846 RepID=A0AAV4P282_CAEEX|nr:hypothetical protein CEXT_129901 [Caerostris extrusa]
MTTINTLLANRTDRLKTKILISDCFPIQRQIYCGPIPHLVQTSSKGGNSVSLPVFRKWTIKRYVLEFKAHKCLIKSTAFASEQQKKPTSIWSSFCSIVAFRVAGRFNICFCVQCRCCCSCR